MLGGDCSIAVSAAYALRTRAPGGLGLVHVDGHTDFRHPGNSDEGAARTADRVLGIDGLRDGFWLQVDVDVPDPTWMPAVDSPDPGGLSPDQLVDLLRRLAPHAAGASVTVYDPDLDPEGRYATLVTDVVVDGLAGLGPGR